MKKLLILIVTVATAFSQAKAQSVVKELQADVNRAAGMFYALPVGKMPKDTPAPAGKKPFYINHYGCPGSYYLDKKEYYDDTYATLAKADSLGKLTKLGKDVLRRIELLCQDALNRDGELTPIGAKQSRDMVKQLVERYPDMFTPKGYCREPLYHDHAGRTAAALGHAPAHHSPQQGIVAGTQIHGPVRQGSHLAAHRFDYPRTL